MRTKILIGALFVALVAIYFRFVIAAPEGALLTNHLATDLYGHFVHVWERLGLLREGFIPLGDYWVLRGGGFPAALNDQGIMQHEFLLMVMYAISGSLEAALRALVPILYLATVVTAFWYGRVLFKRTDAAVVLAVAYGFCTYGVNQLEHLELIGVQPFILLTLIFLEKTLVMHRPRYIILTGVFAFMVFTSNLYPLYFLAILVAARLIWHLLSTPRRAETLRSAGKIAAIVLLATIPLILPTVVNTMPSEARATELGEAISGYSQPPILYFYRNVPYEPYTAEIYTMYIGLSVLLLALVPMVMKSKHKGLYVFHIVLAGFFMLYSIGQYGSVNLASWVHSYAPLAFFIRVPGRAMVVGCLSIAICAAYGFTLIADKIPRRRYLFLLAIVAVLFVDLTVGFEHRTMPSYFNGNGAYAYVREQPGDFRLLEVPSVHDQQAMATIYTGQDTVGPVLWAFGLFGPLETFAGEYWTYADNNIDGQRSAQYNIKYVIVHTDPEYYSTLETAMIALSSPTRSEVEEISQTLETSQDYTLVYSGQDALVYENTHYEGFVYTLESVPVTYERLSPEHISIEVEGPATVVISQSYHPGWQVTDSEYGIFNYKDMQAIQVAAGVHYLELRYTRHHQWALMAGAFLVALLGVILSIWRKELWFLRLIASLVALSIAFVLTSQAGLYFYAVIVLCLVCAFSVLLQRTTTAGGTS